MAVDGDRIYQALRHLDSDKGLRNLLERELGCDYEGGLISADELPAGVEEEIATDPTLIASTARDSRFTVIHTRLNTSGKLSLSTERRIIERLKKSYPYSLYVFSDSNDKLWHFVNAPLDPEAQAPGHLSGRKQYRRLVVGPGERFRTATERISLLSVDELAEKSDQEPEDLAPLAIHAAHDEAFDVEAVTKQFFREYRRVFESVEESVTGVEDEDRRRYFVQRLFNRLMFIAFIEKKGWMSFRGRTDYLPALWEDYASKDRGENDFYNGHLKPLFFQGFNSQDNREEENPVIGVVPYLNGGLFEEDDDDRDESIDVPDECLDEIINGLFAGFNFTTTESTPLDVEVAVDPEMLGKVFEELVTGRHEVGAYYTPKEIVSFMCREALKGHLEDRLEASDEDDKEAVRVFVEEHDPAELHDPEAALGALREVKVCDPACGSGAYLLGMMRELLDLRESLFVTVNIDPSTTYQRKLEIIQNNLYGVDIDPFAVNIARLRLWLSLVVDYEGETPPPLPNLDFKIEAGDSLTGPRPTGELETPDMFRDDQIEEYFRLKSEYLKSHGEIKEELREQITELRTEIAEYAHPGETIGGFDWEVEFAEIFVNGGFDAVLANPPYVRHELIRNLKPRMKALFPEVYKGTADLYVYFYGRALQILQDGGMLTFISPNKWFRASYGTKLRSHLASGSHVRSITDFGDLPIFQTATTYPMILTAKKSDDSNGSTQFTPVETLDPPYPDMGALVREAAERLPPEAISGEDWLLTDASTASRMTRMRASGSQLGEYIDRQMYYGIKTGLNKAFIINAAKRDELVSRDPISAEIIKPLVTGRDIKKWAVDYQDKWLIVTPIGVHMERYPAVFAHLQSWQVDLERRYDKGNHWWELRPCGYYSAFDKPKLVFPDIARSPRFAFDPSGTYLANTAYIIPIDDLYLLGVLNSLAVEDFYGELSSEIRGGYLRFIYQYVSKIPVPNATVTDRNTIASLVQNCLDTKGVGCEESEREIDERVAFLYGLNAQNMRDIATRLDGNEGSGS